MANQAAPRSMEDILAGLPDEVSEVVKMPEWGVDFTVRGLSRATANEILEGGHDDTMANVIFLNRGVVEPPMSKEQALRLFAKPGQSKAIKRLTGAIMRLSGVGEGAADAAEAAFRVQP